MDEDELLLKKFKEMDEKDAQDQPEALYHVGKFKSFPKDKFRVQSGHHQLETQRCEGDILYCLFRRPKTVAKLLLNKFHELALKKNSPDLGQSRMFRDAMSFLIDNPRASMKIIIFQILLFICREEEAQATILEYNKAPMGHLEKFVSEFSNYISDVFKMPFGEGNVIFIVNRFVQVAETMYLTK